MVRGATQAETHLAWGNVISMTTRTGKLEVLNKVAVSTQYRGKTLCNAFGRYQGWTYIMLRIELYGFGPSPFR